MKNNNSNHKSSYFSGKELISDNISPTKEKVEDNPSPTKEIVKEKTSPTKEIIAGSPPLTKEIVIDIPSPTKEKIIGRNPLQNPKANITKPANYCGMCGHKFDDQTDRYCPDCGEERMEITD